MNDDLKQTMKILRSSKVKTDERGRTVWVDPVETAKLELVSTQMLKQIIATDDDATKDNLREVADGESGLLARDVDKGGFEVISDTELQKILDGTDNGTDDDSTAEPAQAVEQEQFFEESATDALELVSTQMLRRILRPEEDDEKPPPEPAFNPYDSG